MHRLQRQMDRDSRWDSVIDRLEIKYGLHLDDWKRLGRDQMGQKCGRGWVGLRGACERGKKSDDNTEKIKKSKRALADKIRARKGLRDRNAPKALPPTLKKAADLKEGDRIRFTPSAHDKNSGDYQVTGRLERLGMKYIQATKLTTTGKPIGKGKIFLEEYLQAGSNKGINLDPGPIEKTVRVKKEKPQPIEDMNKGRLGPSISPSNVVATDKRFTSAAINNALDQIQSEGASERLSNVRSIIEAQGIQAVFRGKGDNNGKLAEGVESKGKWHERISERIAKLDDQIESGAGWDSTVKLRNKFRKQRDKSLVGDSVKAAGYTSQENRHVVVLAGKEGKSDYPSFTVTPQEMQDMADKALSPPNEKPVFTVGGSGRGAAANLVTYLHEVGHQVHWISESKDPSLAAKAPRLKPVTRYGATNNKEFFAEGFALWTLDAKGLKEKNPEMHDYIQESVTAAMGAKRRVDSIDNYLGEPMIAPVQPSDIAQTPLGQQAFTIVLSGDSSWDAYKSLDGYAAAAKVGTEQDETMAAIEAFIVSGGEFTEPIDFSRKDSTHFDSTEITRYTRAIASLNDRYGWHLDAQKVLSKLGKKLGKKCGGGWISPEKKCKSHYTNGKLNDAGKSSGENLADRIRQRKKLSTVSRDGKGHELTYAFLPGDQKQSTMTARRTHAPRSGYETPGRLSNVNSTEERRSIVGLGHNPGVKSKPDTAPIMDTPTKRAAPIEARTRKMNANPSAGDRIRAVAQTLKEQDKIQKGATVGVLKAAEQLYVNQNKMINEVSTMVNKDLDRAAARGGKNTIEPTQPQSEPVAKTSAASPSGETRTRKMNTAVVGSAGDRLRAIAGKLKDEESIQKGATVGVLKAAEKLYVNQHKMIGEVAGIANEDLNNAAAKGVRKMFDPAQTPVRIPNQRSSNEPRRRGRSVD